MWVLGCLAPSGKRLLLRRSVSLIEVWYARRVMLRRFNDRLIDLMWAYPWVTIPILLVVICVIELAG